MKKNKVAEMFLEQLKRVPIVQVACEKSGVSRNSVYRWRNEDPKFRTDMEAALAEGEALVNDMTESHLISLIKEKNYPAISFWLRHRNPKFKDKLEISGKVETSDMPLTEEQKAVVRKALSLATFTKDKENK